MIVATLKNRSILSLLLISLMFVFNFYTIYALIEDQKEIGKFINISGKQRMLSQRITLLSEKYYAAPSVTVATKLKQAITEMRGNARYIQLESRGAVRHIFEGKNYRLAYYTETFLSEAEKILKGDKNRNSLSYLQSINEYILKSSDTVVTVFEQQYATYVTEVRIWATFIMIASLVLVAILYLLVLRPALKKNELLLTEIRDSEAKMKGITDNTDNIIFIKDTQGRYLFVNRSFETAFNTSNRAIQGQTDYQFFSEEEAELFVKNDRQVTRTLAKISTHEFAYQNGIRHYYLVDKFPVFKGDGSIYGVGGVATDISEMVKLQKKMEEYVELIDENIITSQTDTKGVITYVSDAFCRISGYSKEELMGQEHDIVRHEDMPDSIYKELWETIKSGRSWHGEIKNKTKEGGYYWVDATIHPNYDEKGEKIIGYTAIRQDITNKKRIEEISITDELTGLHNRRYFNQMVEEEFNRCKRDGQRFTFLVMDVDNFKKYNDTYGHQEGDKVLSSIGKVLREHTQRAGDYAFRLGGEEFGVLLHAANESDACKGAEGIRESIEQLGIVHAKNLPYGCVTVSVGIKSITPSVTEKVTVDDIYREADERLYRAKENGRNRVEICHV